MNELMHSIDINTPPAVTDHASGGGGFQFLFPYREKWNLHRQPSFLALRVFQLNKYLRNITDLICHSYNKDNINVLLASKLAKILVEISVVRSKSACHRY